MVLSFGCIYGNKVIVIVGVSVREKGIRGGGDMGVDRWEVGGVFRIDVLKCISQCTC